MKKLIILLSILYCFLPEIFGQYLQYDFSETRVFNVLMVSAGNPILFTKIDTIIINTNVIEFTIEKISLQKQLTFVSTGGYNTSNISMNWNDSLSTVYPITNNISTKTNDRMYVSVQPVLSSDNLTVNRTYSVSTNHNKLILKFNFTIATAFTANMNTRISYSIFGKFKYK